MPDKVNVPEYSFDEVVMPPARFFAPTEHLLRDGNSFVLFEISTDEQRARFKKALLDELRARQEAEVKALEADNLDAFSSAFASHCGMVGVILNINETGDNSRPQEDGAWEGGWALHQLKTHYVPETIHVKVDRERLLRSCQRVRLFERLRDDMGSFSAALDQTLAAEQREIAPQVRDAYRRLEPDFVGHWGLRRMGKALIDYASGAAKLAVERARSNKRLVEETKSSMLGQIRSALGGGTPTDARPPGAPATPPTPPTPPADDQTSRRR